jgi:hypothetical protein
MSPERKKQREEGGASRGLTEPAQGKESDKRVITARGIRQNSKHVSLRMFCSEDVVPPPLTPALRPCFDSPQIFTETIRLAAIVNKLEASLGITENSHSELHPEFFPKIPWY